jgi:CheY-like chemotaxis protein
MGESKAMEALFPGPRRLILTAVFCETERWWTLVELAGRAGVQPSSARRHIGPLRDSGVLDEKNDDGKLSYRANTSCPVFVELQAIVSKLTRATEGCETVMIVEDQPATAQITRILLESWGYRVIEAHSGAEALCLFDQKDEEIHLLLTDVLMPGITGPQLADEIHSRCPSLRVVFMSGYPSDELTGRNCSFLPKPFNPASLSKMIRKELDRREHTRRAH